MRAIKFVEDSPHQSLWKIIVEKALMDLDYANAEKALLKIDDFKTLKYVKKLVPTFLITCSTYYTGCSLKPKY